jgi:hypothetical protein
MEVATSMGGFQHDQEMATSMSASQHIATSMGGFQQHHAPAGGRSTRSGREFVPWGDSEDDDDEDEPAHQSAAPQGHSGGVHSQYGGTPSSRVRSSTPTYTTQVVVAPLPASTHRHPAPDPLAHPGPSDERSSSVGPAFPASNTGGCCLSLVEMLSMAIEPPKQHISASYCYASILLV